jgi:hypothetical protein
MTVQFDDLNILGYLRADETYLWLYHDHQLADVQRSLGRFASNPDLSFTWHDAAICSQRARQQIEIERPKQDQVLEWKSCQRNK